MQRRAGRAHLGVTALALVMVALLGACGSGDAAPVPPALPGDDDVEVVDTTTATTAAPTTTIARPFAGTLAAPTAAATATTLAPPPVATTVPPKASVAPVPAPTATAKATKLPVPAPVPPERATEAKVLLGRIAIPKLGIDMDMWEGVTLNTLDRGPGHWPGTAMPGQTGNVVVAGHRVSHSRPFRYLDRLVEGDEVVFTVGGVAHRYVVTGHEIVPPTAVRIIEQTPDATATLFACHPPGSTRYRWVTHLKLAA